MTKDLKHALKVFDDDTADYLESNRHAIFSMVTINQPIPQGIKDYLDIVYAKRKVLVDAINAIENIDPTEV